jgi:broad specificity phosphatase PhoE
LDELGRVQADALGTVFAADPPSVVVTSDLVRASATAQAVCDHIGLPLLVDARLRETHWGVWQGLEMTEIEQRWPDELLGWRRFESGPVGGEGPPSVGERAVAAVLEHLPAAGTLLAVTHGGTARAIVGTLLEWPVVEWWRIAPLGNTCWTTLIEGDRGWRLERHNTGLGPLTGAPTGAG